jgi:hypothetical protein
MKYVLIFHVIHAGHKTRRFTKDVNTVKYKRSQKVYFLYYLKPSSLQLTQGDDNKKNAIASKASNINQFRNR